MDKFTQYAKNKIEIARLEKECEELKKEILPEVRILKYPMIVEGGKFTVTVRKSYKFSEVVESFERDMKEKVSILKDQEIESGTAKETISESLVFTANKDGKNTEAK